MTLTDELDAWHECLSEEERLDLTNRIGVAVQWVHDERRRVQEKEFREYMETCDLGIPKNQTTI
jgi:nicotinamide riboside kinase